jgi:hypothetical protein
LKAIGDFFVEGLTQVAPDPTTRLYAFNRSNDQLLQRLAAAGRRDPGRAVKGGSTDR